MSNDTHKRTHEGFAKMDTTLTSAEVIAKRGDVILHVGKEPQAEKKLLVSSALLSHMSPVFAVMFDGRFAEGQALNTASPCVVPLPEDGADSMAIVCKIMHARTEDLSVTITPTQLADIAAICHKYDCVNAVRAWSIIWVAELLPKPTATDFEKILIATYLLDMASEFLQVSKSLIRDRCDLLSISAMSNGEDFLPLRLLERIAKEQHQTQTRAFAALGPIVRSGMNTCENTQQEIGIFFQSLRKIGIWPQKSMSVRLLKAGLAKMPDRKFAMKPCSNHQCLCKSTSLDAKTLLVDVTRVYDTVKGVCLDCVKRKELGVLRPICHVACDGNNLTYD
ncbi:hypothetical protein N0V95_002821 [Ascochyta clinopodiicola]|nr:hypothetical protein N0V95_002821 [Ascochyta clinopodiicola]